MVSGGGVFLVSGGLVVSGGGVFLVSGGLVVGGGGGVGNLFQ